MIDRHVPHSSHWGAFRARMEDGRLRITPHPADPDPSPLLRNLPAAVSHPVRIARPAFRRGWLERGPGPDDRRGRDEYVEMDWPEALDRVAWELRRVYADHGAKAVFGGSYGWSSAGRFHHAQSQIHRFLNVLGGYVRSVNNYSAGAAMVIIPHVLGSYDSFERRSVSWRSVAEHTELVVAFGGMAIKNAMVNGGGNSRHIVRGAIDAAARRGAKFVHVSPLRDDMPAEAASEWMAIVPGTDTALMLAIAHTLASEALHDTVFLEKYTTGYRRFEAYLMGREDGAPKSADWAEPICGIAADRIRHLARAMARARTVVTVSHSLQRAEHGEQPVWMGIVLAAMLGQIGQSGGGFSYSLGALGNIGKDALAVPLPTLSQGSNGVDAFIPVARIADMLLNPGGSCPYNGRTLTYPDIRLVYWAGGNPFHHHQDLNNLRRAFARPETIVVHETAWTATARHADIVLPVTVTMEREDIGASSFDPLMIAMHRLVAPFGAARNDYEIFCDLAARLDVAPAFTEGRSARQWLEAMYATTEKALRQAGHTAPTFEAFWNAGELELPTLPDDGGPARAFREEPSRHKLKTPSGKIEIYSETIAGFGYADCAGHPKWFPPVEGHGSAAMERYPLHLIANQPATRLHSQLDFGALSQESKVAGREPVRIHPLDAARRGIAEGAVVRLYNDRGYCLAGAVLSESVRPGVLQLATGAWFEPVDPEARITGCMHGNPNILTRDAGTSSLAQGSTGQLTCVEIESFHGEALPVRVTQCMDRLILR